MSNQINVVIPARREYPQLVWTIYSFIVDMPSWAKWHVYVVTNDADEQQKQMDDWLRSGRLARFGHLTVETLTEATHPHKCIHHVAEQLTDGLMFYSCAHISIERGTLEKMASLTSRDDVGLVHSPQLWMPDYPDATGKRKLYSYKHPIYRGWTWERKSDVPYKICGGSAALACVKVSDWKEVGGCDVPFRRGIGGCETFMDMKFWMFGKSVWLHPDSLYYHWTRTRGYNWTMGEHSWNQLVAFYCLGGRQFMESENQKLSYPQPKTVLDNVEQLSSSHRTFIQENAKFTLNEILQNKPWLN